MLVPVVAVLMALAPGRVRADPLVATHFVPERHAANVCGDTPLSITFNQVW